MARTKYIGLPGAGLLLSRVAEWRGLSCFIQRAVGVVAILGPIRVVAVELNTTAVSLIRVLSVRVIWDALLSNGELTAFVGTVWSQVVVTGGGTCGNGGLAHTTTRPAPLN